MMLPIVTVLFMKFMDESNIQMNDTEALLYMQQYGYLDLQTTNITIEPTHLTTKSLQQAISEFQNFAGIDVTGEMNEATIALMRLPRCGNKDITSSTTRRRRFAVQGSRWRRKSTLIYKITSFPRTLSKQEVRQEIDKAFQVWSNHTNLEFIPATSFESADIEIQFNYKDHGDEDPFDGPGGTLAHASFPIFGGDIHFDAEEAWTKNSYRGINLFQTATHEIGHCLGLDHSSVRKAVMAPFYKGYTPGFRLNRDDIKGIQSLYGIKPDPPTTPANTVGTPKASKKENNVTAGGVIFTSRNDAGHDDTKNDKPVTDNPLSKPDPYLCSRPRIDAIFNGADKKTYIFRYSKYWELNGKEIASGYPKWISRRWQTLTGYVDAAFTAINGKTYIFKGSKFWKYHGWSLLPGYPKNIYRGFPGIPNNIDAALAIKNGTVFFFKDDQVWRFTPVESPPVNPAFPKLITDVFKGAPDYVDAAYQSDEDIFFFRGDSYYKINSATFKVEDAQLSFPRDIKDDWFNCKTEAKHKNGDDGSNFGSICNNPIIDTIFRTPDDLTYIFTGGRFWSFRNIGNLDSAPELISQQWPELPCNIDTAFTAKNNRTYFFKGSLFWRYKGNEIDRGYPKNISRGFLEIPDEIDAILPLDNKETVYIFKGNKVWKYTSKKYPPVAYGFPKNINDLWTGVPNDIDAIYQDINNNVYFFKESQYYNLSAENFLSHSGHSLTTGSTGLWFGCKSALRFNNILESAENLSAIED